MSAVSTTVDHDAGAAIRQERSNVLRLAICQALVGANSTVVYATGAVAGYMLAPSKALATPTSTSTPTPRISQRSSRAWEAPSVEWHGRILNWEATSVLTISPLPSRVRQ